MKFSRFGHGEARPLAVQANRAIVQRGGRIDTDVELRKRLNQVWAPVDVLEDLLTTIAPAHDMIHRDRIFDSQLARLNRTNRQPPHSRQS